MTHHNHHQNPDMNMHRLGMAISFLGGLGGLIAAGGVLIGGGQLMGKVSELDHNAEKRDVRIHQVETSVSAVAADLQTHSIMDQERVSDIKRRIELLEQNVAVVQDMRGDLKVIKAQLGDLSDRIQKQTQMIKTGQ